MIVSFVCKQTRFTTIPARINQITKTIQVIRHTSYITNKEKMSIR